MRVAGKLIDGGRPAHQVSLSAMALLGSKEAELRLRFNALSHNRHLKAAAQADHRAHNRRRLLVAVDRPHKGAINLDLIERERA